MGTKWERVKDERGDAGVLVDFDYASAPTRAFRGRVAEARTHRKRRDVCATRPRGQGRRETTKIEIRKTNLECALESTVSLFGISLQHRRWERG